MCGHVPLPQHSGGYRVTAHRPFDSDTPYTSMDIALQGQKYPIQICRFKVGYIRDGYAGVRSGISESDMPVCGQEYLTRLYRHIHEYPSRICPTYASSSSDSDMPVYGPAARVPMTPIPIYPYAVGIAACCSGFVVCPSTRCHPRLPLWQTNSDPCRRLKSSQVGRNAPSRRRCVAALRLSPARKPLKVGSLLQSSSRALVESDQP